MIDKKIVSEAVKYFKENGIMTPALARRRYKLSLKSANELCEMIEKRFPNLWREGRIKFYGMDCAGKR